MEKEYITIKEYAEIIGKSVQSVYAILKKEDSNLKDFVYTVNGKRVLKSSILDNCKNKNIVEKKQETEVEDYSNTSEDNDFVTNLKEQIIFLKEQIEKKDETITILHNTINSLENTVNEQVRVISNSQQLLLVEKTSNGNVIMNDNDKEVTPTENQETTKKEKRGFWFFGRN